MKHIRTAVIVAATALMLPFVISGCSIKTSELQSKARDAQAELWAKARAGEEAFLAAKKADGEEFKQFKESVAAAMLAGDYAALKGLVDPSELATVDKSGTVAAWKGAADFDIYQSRAEDSSKNDSQPDSAPTVVPPLTEEEYGREPVGSYDEYVASYIPRLETGQPASSWEPKKYLPARYFSYLGRIDGDYYDDIRFIRNPGEDWRVSGLARIPKAEYGWNVYEGTDKHFKIGTAEPSTLWFNSGADGPGKPILLGNYAVTSLNSLSHNYLNAKAIINPFKEVPGYEATDRVVQDAAAQLADKVRASVDDCTRPKKACVFKRSPDQSGFILKTWSYDNPATGFWITKSGTIEGRLVLTNQDRTEIADVAWDEGSKGQYPNHESYQRAFQELMVDFDGNLVFKDQHWGLGWRKLG